MRMVCHAQASPEETANILIGVWDPWIVDSDAIGACISIGIESGVIKPFYEHNYQSDKLYSYWDILEITSHTKINSMALRGKIHYVDILFPMYTLFTKFHTLKILTVRLFQRYINRKIKTTKGIF